MCATCVTAVDVVGTNLVLIGVATANGWERLRDRLQRRHRIEREVLTWEANAAFLRGLDLDPLDTIGPPPAITSEVLDRLLTA